MQAAKLDQLSLGVQSPFFPGTLLSRQFPETQGKRIRFLKDQLEKNGWTQPLEAGMHETGIDGIVHLPTAGLCQCHGSPVNPQKSFSFDENPKLYTTCLVGSHWFVETLDPAPPLNPLTFMGEGWRILSHSPKVTHTTGTIHGSPGFSPHPQID